MHEQQEEPAVRDEMEEIRGDIRAVVAKLDRLIGDRSEGTDPAQT
jgi:hypothetical protein